MIKPKMLLILPKLDTYEFKGSDIKFFMRQTIMNEVAKMKKVIVLPYLLAEDELAWNLFYDDKDVVWVSALSTMNSLLLLNNTDIYEQYRYTSEKKYSNDIIKTVSKTISLAKNTDNQVEDMFRPLLVKSLLSRIRATAAMYIKDFPIVIYCKKGSGYTRPYIPEVGDKKVYVEINLENDIIRYYYSGCLLDENTFYDKILPGVIM